LDAREVRRVPGAFGDAFRAVEALPGATPIASGFPYVLLRGAPPGNTGYFIDGVPVPLLFHVAFGPSVIAPALIGRLDYYPGGYPARLGRYVGGAVSAETTRPAGRPRAEVTVRAFDAGGLVETAIGDRVDALVAGRYSYTAPALSIFSPGVDLGYWDYQGRAGYRLSDSDRVSVFAFGSHDFRSDLPGVPSTFAADFHRIDVRYDRSFTGGRLRLAATAGVDRSSNEQGNAGDQLARVRLEVTRAISPEVSVHFGTDAVVDHFDAGVAANSEERAAIAQTYPEHQDVTVGAYAELVWRPNARVEIVPGLRADLYDWRRPGLPIAAAGSFSPRGFGGLPPPVGSAPFPMPDVPPLTRTIPAFDPRLAVRLRVHPMVTLLSMTGLFHQGPSFVVPVPGVQPGGLPRGLQSALQLSAGFELALPFDLAATATVFWNEFRNVSDFRSCSFQYDEINVESGCVDARARGRSYGLEVLVRRALTRRLGGWISYTLSQTTDEASTAPYLGALANASVMLPTQFDRTHVVNVVAAYDVALGWSAGARLFIMSGRPYYTFADGLPGFEVQQSSSLAPPAVLSAPYSVQRFPLFYRIDLRIEKRWPVFGSGWIALVLEGLNVTFQKEAVDVSCPISLGAGPCTPIMGSPFTIPSVGVEGAL
jgi:hypothetical protein